MCTPSRLPNPLAHFTQRRSSCKAGADHKAKWAQAWGGEGSELEVLERREEDVDLRRWRAWRRLGERERRWRGLGVGDGYGRRGKQEAQWGSWGEAGVDMGRRWRACGAWRSGSGGGGGWGRGLYTCGGGSEKPGGACGGRGRWTWGGGGTRGGA